MSNFVSKKCLKVYSQPNFSKLINKSVLNPESRYLLVQSRANKSLTAIKSSSHGRLPKKEEPVSNLFKQNKDTKTLLPTLNSNSVMGKFNKAERKTIFNMKSKTPGPGYNWFS